MVQAAQGLELGAVSWWFFLFSPFEAIVLD